MKEFKQKLNKISRLEANGEHADADRLLKECALKDFWDRFKNLFNKKNRSNPKNAPQPSVTPPSWENDPNYIPGIAKPSETPSTMPQAVVGPRQNMPPAPPAPAPKAPLATPTQKPKESTIPSNAIELAGDYYVDGPWKNGVASFYDPTGNGTAWWNSQPGKNRGKQDQVNWKGITNWYEYGDYANSIPTAAHKTLRFGTFVKIRWGGKEVIVLITDRGPFVKERDFDLSPFAHQQLGFDGIGKIQYSVLQKVENVE